jgi:hypothetical protein
MGIVKSLIFEIFPNNNNNNNNNNEMLFKNCKTIFKVLNLALNFLFSDISEKILLFKNLNKF